MNKKQATRLCTSLPAHPEKMSSTWRALLWDQSFLFAWQRQEESFTNQDCHLFDIFMEAKEREIDSLLNGGYGSRPSTEPPSMIKGMGVVKEEKVRREKNIAACG